MNLINEKNGQHSKGTFLFKKARVKLNIECLKDEQGNLWDLIIEEEKEEKL